jgi:hypothetical protein
VHEHQREGVRVRRHQTGTGQVALPPILRGVATVPGPVGRRHAGHWTPRSQSPGEDTHQANRIGSAARRQVLEQPHLAPGHPDPSRRRRQPRRTDATQNTAHRRSPGPSTQPHPNAAVQASPLVRTSLPPHPLRHHSQPICNNSRRERRSEPPGFTLPGCTCGWVRRRIAQRHRSHYVSNTCMTSSP